MIKKEFKKPVQIIIFGATGELAYLKLFPAIFDLFAEGRLADEFEIIGVGRSDWDKNDFQKYFSKSILEKYGNINEGGKKILDKLNYFQIDYNNSASFSNLADFASITGGKEKDQLAYFSVPPEIFSKIIQGISVNKNKFSKNLKLILEKPFGTDLKSCQELFTQIKDNFNLKNVFFLDHYLGKTPIQGILKLRNENAVINQLLRGNMIANIQLTAHEVRGVSERVGYFDHVGIVRDMIQSHLLQILALICMEIPLKTSRANLHKQKASFLGNLKFAGGKNNLLVGQFDDYLKIENVAENSKTETYAALKLNIDSREWYKVPVFIRAGKKLAENKVMAVIEFKKMPFQKKNVQPNRMVFELKPDEKVDLVLYEADENTPASNAVILNKSLVCQGDYCLSEYGNLLLDAMNNKRDFFLEIDEVIACWKLIDQVMKAKQKMSLLSYESGSDGPKEFKQFSQKNNINWYEDKKI